MCACSLVKFVCDLRTNLRVILVRLFTSIFHNILFNLVKPPRGYMRGILTNLRNQSIMEPPNKGARARNP